MFLLLCVAWATDPLPPEREPGAAPAAYAIPTDPVLDALIRESLAARPEIAAAEDAVRARGERAVQAGALPDPTLSVGIQNDGFRSIEIGRMESSYVSLMASQAFPWPGKLALRTDISELQVGVAESELSRARLGTEAEVRRAYVDLLLARERLRLLGRLTELWDQSEKVARVRYETGEGNQADVFRAQLERGRLQQRKWSLEAEERVRVQALNRLRVRPLDAPIEPPVVLRDLPLPELGERDALLEDTLRRSPELAAARLAVEQAGRATALARKGWAPDLSVGAGLMARGPLPPMWAAEVSFPIPAYGGRKQARAVAENVALADAAERQADALAQVLAERVAERAAQWAALREVVELYRRGLLVQSAATAESTLGQYQVGRVGFTSVLEAVAGYIGDEDAFVQSLAELHRIAIQHAEVSLDPVGLSTGAMGGTGMSSSPAAGPAAPIRGGAPGPAPAAASDASTSSMGM
ncbi:MAG: TolC family protein [Myxococcota bacterium]